MNATIPAVVLLTTAQACQELERFVPDVRFSHMDVAEIDFEHVDAEFVFAIDNPNPVEVGLSSFSYALGLEGVELLDGTDADGFQIEAVGASELALPLSLSWRETWDAVQATRGEDLVDFALTGHLGFDTPVGEVQVPYDEAGAFPALRTPRLSVSRIRVQSVNLLTQQARIEVDLGIDNPHGSTLFFDDFAYELDLGGASVATGTIASLAGVEGATEATVALPVVVDLLGVGSEVVEAITGRDPLRFGLDATVDVDTPWGILPLSIDESGTVTVE